MLGGHTQYPGDSSLLSRSHRNVMRSFLHKVLQLIVQSRYGNLPSPMERTPEWVSMNYLVTLFLIKTMIHFAKYNLLVYS